MSTRLADRVSERRGRAARLLLALSALCLVHVGAFGCLHVEHGIVVELAASALPTGGATRVWLHDGTELAVESGAITVSEAELLPCRSASTPRLEMLRAILGPARAMAQHEHEASPFSLGGPFRVSLTDAQSVLGAFTPPPGSYCGVHVELGPAADAADAPPWTITLRAHTPEGTPVVAASDGPGAVHLELDAPLVLDRRGTTVLRASFYEDHTFARLPALVPGIDALGAALLRGAAAQGALRAEPAPPL